MINATVAPITEATDHQTEELLCSVIVPVYNGAATVTRCLDALAAQSVASDRFEIIVVDDGSQDATVHRIDAWREAHSQCRLRLLRQPNAGPAVARNHGAQAAHAPLLLFTDADCAPLPTWVDELSAPFADQTIVGAKGTYVTRQTAATARFVQAEYEDRYDRMRGLGQIDFIDTYSAAYRRDIFLENGGFDGIFTTASVEDQEFSFRLAQKGYRLVFAPAAQVEHLHDETLHAYARRKYYIGYWKALLTQRHPARMVNDSHTPQVLKVQIVLTAALLALLPLAGAGSVWPPLRPVWWGIAGLSLLLLTTALPFLAKLAHRQPGLLVMGPLLLGVRAMALGTGYVAGTIHFTGPKTARPTAVIPGWKRVIKRTLDIVGALVGLVISIPFVALAAVAIKMDSPGPVFFRQVRVGENGHNFTMMKLRSMVPDAEAQLDQLVDLSALDEPAYKLVNDPRVTRVGRVLRQTSLDEAPQFLNVLRGQMSLVGPRPEEARIVALYTDDQRRRLAVKPGLTGPMQINGRGELPFAQRLRYELEYIDQFSLRRDLQILLATIPSVLRRKGAF